MSELKAHRFITTDELWPGANAGALYYEKPEADKALAELEDKLQAADKQIENLINSASSIMLSQNMANDNICAELRHHKYKRCLAMAKICQLRGDRYERYLASLAYHGLPTIQRCRVLKNHYDKWYSRWLELAKKVKEAK